LTEHLPFSQSFTSKWSRHPLPVKRVNSNLGTTFYPRLIAIYNNFMEALVSNNYGYIRKTAVDELAGELICRKEQVKSQNIKLKINEPGKKLLPLKNYFMPETVYRNDNFYVSVVCKVYFGGEFSINRPYHWQPEEKLIWLGRNRCLVLDTSKSYSQNLENMRTRQIYEFVVRVDSNLYLNLYDLKGGNLYQPQQVKVRYEEDQLQDVVSTEMVLRSSSDKFDWVLCDLNGMLRRK
jgi:hypothetical protein